MNCYLQKSVPKIGGTTYGEPHFWWHDKNMVEILKNSKIDYLIWVAPYKYFLPVNKRVKVKLPVTVVFDIKKIEYEKLKEYPIDKMQSIEL